MTKVKTAPKQRGRQRKPSVVPENGMGKPEGPLEIRVGRQGGGAVYVLNSRFRRWIRETFPNGHWAPDVFIAYRKKSDFEQAQRPYWEPVAQMLTGLTREELAEFGSIRIFEELAGEEWLVPLRADQGTAGKTS